MKPLAQINVIPFIDIMLVLLAVVLTTATFVAQGKIPINLPSASQAKPIPRSEHIKIAIDESGVIYWDEQALTLDELDTRVAARAQPANNARFLLHVDEDARFLHFVGIIDLLKKHKVEDISIVTERQ
uniref:Biopolymer transport protein ExbD n=1 Tax=Candidatus Kentrum sp. FW TaxID=2126338 RepID=A0A450S8J7_9GAMM|nr:MAG: biopolymer transport protein ExbD [Candidatus Kentron sp. FW]VFJ53661.1 MAG: biopolymer transport protein ExbD [Candidatus Kentron sp. FW]VFJ71215.1 MAG: biopolymer transport protein ExbD [Candidatus Kentron sp. FW]